MQAVMANMKQAKCCWRSRDSNPCQHDQKEVRLPSVFFARKRFDFAVDSLLVCEVDGFYKLK
jgi:hypothetical protein